MLDEEEKGTRKKEGRGGRSDEESEKMKKWLEDASLTSGSCFPSFQSLQIGFWRVHIWWPTFCHSSFSSLLPLCSFAKSKLSATLLDVTGYLKSATDNTQGCYLLATVLQKCITKNEDSLFIDKKRTNYCSIMDQYLVWYPLASMTAAILRGMDS